DADGIHNELIALPMSGGVSHPFGIIRDVLRVLCAVGVDDPVDPLILEQNRNDRVVLDNLKRRGRLESTRRADRQTESIRVLGGIDLLESIRSVRREWNRLPLRQRAAQIGRVGPLPNTIEVGVFLLRKRWNREQSQNEERQRWTGSHHRVFIF